ncbi:MAG: DUF3307 domain-containing protein [Paludibacter sp.]|nr:DUF3307 domain-containing protein [Paludibacter sp.]
MYKSFFIIFILHIFGGFFLQSNRISKLKRDNMFYLLQHVALYTLIFIVFSPILLGITFWQGIVYSLINGVLHFIVDFFTGKIKSKMIVKDEVKYNLTVVMDYSIHLALLFITFIWLYPNAIHVVTFWDKY